MFNDFYFIYKMIKGNGIKLKYASLELRDNFLIVFEAVKNNGFALEFVSPRLRNNKEIIKRALKINEDIDEEEFEISSKLLFKQDESLIGFFLGTRRDGDEGDVDSKKSFLLNSSFETGDADF